MINICIIEKSLQAKELLEKNISNIQDAKIIFSLDDFSGIDNIENIDVLIFDIDSKNASSVLEKAKQVKEKHQKICLIATSYEISSALVSQVLSSGVSDFLVKPILFNILEASIKKNLVKKEEKAKTICVYSNKGGIGKTSISVNLAWSIWQKTKQNVCILDLSLNNEDVCVFLDIKQRYNIDFILENLEKSNKKQAISLIDKYQDTDIYALEMQEDILFGQNLDIQKVIKTINLLKNVFDYLIIDVSSDLHELNLSILNNSDLILLISLLNMQGIRSCQKCYEVFDKVAYSDDKIRMVINRYLENQDITLSDIENTTGKKVFYTLPNNYLTLIDAINLGKCVGEINPQSNIAKAYMGLADEVLKIDFSKLSEKKNFDHGIFNLLKRMGE